MKPLKILAASGQLGYGIPPDAFRRGVAARPHVIGADMGSTDPGPSALGSGRDPRSSLVVSRDLEMVIGAGLELGVPVLIGTAGIAGGRPHLGHVAGLIRELARRNGWRFRLALIDAEVDPQWVKQRLAAGQIAPLADSPPLTEAEVEQSVRIVGQMGPEPFQEALRRGADVVLAGRACDTAIFAAWPLMQGADPGLTYHMSKIIECASQCAVPGGRDAIMGRICPDAFEVESMHPDRLVTPTSVAAHSLYEQADPYITHEPGGQIDTRTARFEQVTERVVRVSGSTWHAADPYTIKLEGAAGCGFRTFCIGGVRDPIMLQQIDHVLAGVAANVARAVAGAIAPEAYRLSFRIYGRDGVLGPLETEPFTGHEAGILMDVIAPTQEQAHGVCATARQNLLHYFYPGILATSGNIGFPYSPHEFDAGEVFRFSIYHVAQVASPLELFPISLETVGGEGR